MPQTHYQVFVFLTSANIPLTKASLMAEVMLREFESIFHPLRGGRADRRRNEHLLNSNSIQCSLKILEEKGWPV